MRYLTGDEIRFLQARVLRASGGDPGVRDDEAMEAIPTKLRMSYTGSELFSDIHGKAALLMTLILEHRPFCSGNRRAALAASGVLLRLNGHELVCGTGELVEFCRSTAEGDGSTEEVAEWFRGHTAPAGHVSPGPRSAARIPSV